MDTFRIAERRWYDHSVDPMGQKLLKHLDLVTSHVALANFDLHMIEARLFQAACEKFARESIACIVEQQTDAKLFARRKSARGEIRRVLKLCDRGVNRA